MTSPLASAQPIVVLVTAPSQEQAQAIAHALVESKFAACINLFPIHSIYSWKSEIQQDSEWQLVIKSDRAQFADLEKLVCDRHPYEVPEVIALPVVAGSAAYLRWLNNSIQRSS
jgi:periplasmic divalent cation tolerance protein